MCLLTCLDGWIRERGVKHQAVELIEVARNRELWLGMAELTGMIEGKRSRGRKRMFWPTSLNEWIREREGSNIRQWS